MLALRIWFAAFATLVAAPLGAAETFPLVEDTSSSKTWLVECDVGGDGEFEFQASGPDDKPVTHPVTLTAEFRYAERRLPPAGRDEAAYRSLRHYQTAESEINVGNQTSSPRLRSERRRLVVRIDRSVISPYCPDGPLSSKELELLPSLGDSLLLAALLPGRDIAVGETWTPASWVGPALAGAEVALNGNVTARLESVRDGLAIIRFEGDIEGAVKGAASVTDLAGTLRYDLAAAAIVEAELTQTERRSIGPLMPGMTLTLRSNVRRMPAPEGARISDAETAAIPESPSASALRLEFGTSFGVGITCDRQWQPFHQTSRLLILRLLDRGGLVAQCNVAPAPTVKPGQRTPERQFQEDIARTLGEQLTKIVAAEEITTETSHAIYRVTATGTVAGTERIWRYYLVTTANGRQAALVFTAEPDGLQRLGDRDLELVRSISFTLDRQPTPAQP